MTVFCVKARGRRDPVAPAFSTVFSQTTSFVIAMVVTLSGVWVQWRACWYRMDAEEAMKDGKMNQRQVDQRLRLVNRGGLLLTYAGIVMLLVSLLGYGNG